MMRQTAIFDSEVDLTVQPRTVAGNVTSQVPFNSIGIYWKADRGVVLVNTAVYGTPVDEGCVHWRIIVLPISTSHIDKGADVTLFCLV